VIPYSGAGALEEEVAVVAKVAREDSQAWVEMGEAVPFAYSHGIVE
jgi:hypothetical protein